MSILRFTFEIPIEDGRIEQARALLKYEKAVADFRKALGKHEYHDQIVTPRGPKPAKPTVVATTVTEVLRSTDLPPYKAQRPSTAREDEAAE